jgi:hypothetical protein
MVAISQNVWKVNVLPRHATTDWQAKLPFRSQSGLWAYTENDEGSPRARAFHEFCGAALFQRPDLAMFFRGKSPVSF